MGAKSKYVIVQLASVITGSTRVWVRERAAEKFAGIFYDPAQMDMYLDTTIFGIVVALIVILISILVFILKSFTSHSNTILLVGLSDSGKTRIFSKIANNKAEPITYTSFQENILELNIKGKQLKVVDFPGAERLRKQLIEKWLRKERSSLCGIVFVVDSSSFTKRVRDVAEFLYDVALESGKKIPILAACNKQDHSLAKSCQVINSLLEKEMGLINKSRLAALTTTDGSANRNTLTDTGADFTWNDLIKYIPSSPMKRDRMCLINAGLSQGCDLSDILMAKQQASKFMSFAGPGRRR
uniref:Signal recognition particle receptor subunit beta n=1 Tax=Heterorhabditis bacteriophora TaxID=37862 RepID=A0A1I7X8D4_HETBA